jgi:hypothetical protein
LRPRQTPIDGKVVAGVSFNDKPKATSSFNDKPKATSSFNDKPKATSSFNDKPKATACRKAQATLKPIKQSPNGRSLLFFFGGRCHFIITYASTTLSPSAGR